MECTKSKIIMIGTPRGESNSWLIDEAITNDMLKFEALKTQRNYDMPNNTQALHEAGQKRREENFAMQRVARNISNEAKAEQLELFYQNTVLLLSGYSIYQLQRGV